MGVLLGAALLSNAKSRKRTIEANLAAIGRSITVATKNVNDMQKYLSSWKSNRLNEARMASQNTITNFRTTAAERAGLSGDALNLFINGGSTANLSPEDQQKINNANNILSSLQLSQSQSTAIETTRIEEEYNMLCEMELEPLKDEEKELEQEKDLLQQELEMVNQEIKYAEDMFKNSVKDMFPNYSS